MRRQVLALLLVAFGVAGGVACDSDSARDPALAYLVERAHKDFEAVKELMRKGEDASFACVSVEDAARELKARKRLDPSIPEWDKTCGRDAPLAFARATVARIEAEKPPRAPSCFALERAVGKLEAGFKDDAEVKAVSQKLRSLCP
ncbi:MAG TPA: hypothetical protein VKE22_24530 [Haliangiales bacterium]|nr:hypothetical protein [Haliangiales bacterium]